MTTAKSAWQKVLPLTNILSAMMTAKAWSVASYHMPLLTGSLAQKYRRSEHVNYWLWNDDFYNAPIEDLEYIAELVGVKKGL